MGVAVVGLHWDEVCVAGAIGESRWANKSRVLPEQNTRATQNQRCVASPPRHHELTPPFRPGACRWEPTSILRSLEKEAERRDALSAACARVGVPPAAQGCTREPPSPPREGPPPRLQAKQGFVVYRVAVRRGGRKRPNSKGIVFGKPKNQGINKQKATRNLKAVAEERAGRKLGSLRVLNSYWVNQDLTYKYLR
ncbi:60S ribosomal protein [Batrachochytrium salamandrivorans]|nr:60S ribosomal protein [Batrachochytrium salamandrivorans]